MKVILAEHFGICFGVRDAIAAAQTAGAQAPLTILGELVHNPVVRERLKAQGIGERSLNDPGLPVRGQVMITAHGASDKARDELRRAGFSVLDATCPLVRHAHAQLRRLVEKGFFPVVIGKHRHVEVKGLLGDFPEGIVLENAGDIAHLPVSVRRFGVIAQTTQPITHVIAMVEELRTVRPDAEIVFCDTVCKPTKDRQNALHDLLKQVTVIVVVGGRTSNNTRQLVETARNAGRTAYQVERPDDLQPEWFRGVEVVGLTGGTSTLPETVAAVQRRILELSGNEKGDDDA